MNSSATDKPQARFVFIPVLIAIVLTWSHTPEGVALSMDSLYYLETALNILAGEGISQPTFLLSGDTSEPMTLWPPGYPLVLSVVLELGNALGVADATAIAVFNGVSLLAGVVLFFLIARRTAPPVAAAVGAALFALSPSSQLVHAYAWSEVPFITLMLAGYYCLQRYLLSDRDSRPGVLALSGVVMLLVMATYMRYVGFAFFAAAMLAILLYDKANPVRRFLHVGLASAGFIVAMIPLLWRNLSVAGAISGADRGLSGTNFGVDLKTLVSFVYLEFVNLPVAVGVAVAGIFLASSAWLVRRVPADGRPRIEKSEPIVSIVVPLLFVVAYFGFLLVSRLIQRVDLDTRMISVAVPFILLALTGLYAWLSGRSTRALASVPFVLPVLLLATNAVATHSQVIQGWRQAGEPGRVLDMTYPSISSVRFDALRHISSNFDVGEGSSVITDISRPIILQHMYPDATVRQLPGESAGSAVEELESFAQDKGLVVINTPQWWQKVTEHFDGRTGFYVINGYSGNPEWLVMELPIETP